MATIQSHFDYCITVWGDSFNANYCKLQSLQNRAARIITDNFDWNVSARTYDHCFGWLNVCQRKDLFTSLTIYESLTGLQPNYIADHFTLSRWIYCNPHSKIISY